MEHSHLCIGTYLFSTRTETVRVHLDLLLEIGSIAPAADAVLEYLYWPIPVRVLYKYSTGSGTTVVLYVVQVPVLVLI